MPAMKRKLYTNIGRNCNRRRSMNTKMSNSNGIPIFVACFMLVSAGLIYLLFAPQFRIKSVRVEGEQTVSPASIIAAAQVPMGSNVFRTLLSRQIPRRVIADPRIASVSVRPIVPHTLLIRVVERQPFAVFAANGNHWLIDKDRIPYQLISKTAVNPGLTVIAYTSVLPAGEPVLGQPMPETWLEQAYQLMALVKRTNYLPTQKITVDQSANLCLNRQDNLQIKMGQADSLPFKVAVAQATLSADDGSIARRAAYIDLSSPDQPVWLPKSAVPNGKNEDGTVSGNTSQ